MVVFPLEARKRLELLLESMIAACENNRECVRLMDPGARMEETWIDAVSWKQLLASMKVVFSND